MAEDTVGRMPELAERCEKATGPDAALDEAIMDALFDRQAFVQLADAPEGTGFNSWIDESGRRTSAYRFTASLDAAMTLVPEGMLWGVESYPDHAEAIVRFEYYDGH